MGSSPANYILLKQTNWREGVFMNKQSDFCYGGQAVIEGVMMRGRNYLAVAVRKSNGEIVVKKEPVGSITKKLPFLKWPFLRGVVALCESFTVGLRALLFSADQFLEEEEESKLSPWESFLMIGSALVMTVLLFIVLPLLGRMLFKKFLPDDLFWGNLFESLLRFVILIAYIGSVSFLKDIRRVFSYHGAEHKVINTFEAKKEITVANASGYTTFHPRCGTSFLLYVVVVSAIVFSFLRYDSILMRLISRIVLLPVVAGISYEIIKFTGKHRDFFLWRWLALPGVWLQRMTTREPDESQLEVAINALEAVLEEDAPVIVGGKAYVNSEV